MTAKTSSRDTKRSGRQRDSSTSSNEEDELAHSWNDGHLSAMSKGSGRVKFPRSQLEYFKDELKRLETDAKKRNDKIKAPPLKPYVPYIFNSLRPYTVTQDLRHAIDQLDELRYTPVSRRTAEGPCDPWVSLDMDLNDIGTPRKGIAVGKRERANSTTTPRSSAGNQSPRQSARSTDTKKSASAGGGNTTSRRSEDEDENGRRTSIYPIVTCSLSEEDGEFTKKDMFYNQVPKLREEVRNTYSANASKKMDADYRRTKADFYRRRLDRMEEYSADGRLIMKNAYFAYLTNTPGSAKAVRECVKEAEANEEEDSDKSEKGTKSKSGRRESKTVKNDDGRKSSSGNKNRKEEGGKEKVEAKENKPAKEKTTPRKSKNDKSNAKSGDVNGKENESSKKTSEKEIIGAHTDVAGEDKDDQGVADKETKANGTKDEKEKKDSGRKRKVLKRRNAGSDESNRK